MTDSTTSICQNLETSEVKIPIGTLFPPIDPAPLGSRVIFTAGPIQGAPDWQKQVPPILTELAHEDEFCDRTLVVANPRARQWHGDYYGQVDWELRMLERASMSGVILFWLACADPNAVQPPGRAYAQTSRFELGEWVGRKLADTYSIDLVVGVEEGFPNERYIRHRLAKAFPQMQVHSSLEETVTAAYECLYYPNP
jgi:hypothetical protein